MLKRFSITAWPDERTPRLSRWADAEENEAARPAWNNSRPRNAAKWQGKQPSLGGGSANEQAEIWKYLPPNEETR